MKSPRTAEQAAPADSSLRSERLTSTVTLPPSVRSALQLERDDLVGFEVMEDGRVWLRKARIVFDADGP